MKRTFLILLVVLLLAGVLLLMSLAGEKSREPGEMPAAEAEPAGDPAAPSAEAAVEKAPDFTVTDKDGNPLKLSQQLGKPVVVNFFATWCGPCRSELPAFDAAYAEYGEQVVFLMIDLWDGVQETEEALESFRAENGFRFPICFDTASEAALAYGVQAIPTTLFIAADGSLHGQIVGAINEDTLRRNIESLLEE